MPGREGRGPARSPLRLRECRRPLAGPARPQRAARGLRWAWAPKTSCTLGVMLRRSWQLALLILMTNCSSPWKTCTEIGMESAVGARSEAPGMQVVRLCVDGRCQESEGPLTRVPVRDDPATYAYTLTVVEDGTERELKGRVTTKEYFVNGRGCPPPTANATLFVSETYEVTARTP